MSNAASSPSTSSRVPLPGYETMIIDALEHLPSTKGVPPQGIFNYMMNKWPLAPNFRPSAYQALQRALKRGRLTKTDSLYALAADWNEEEGTPSRTPRRRPANMHASPPANANANAITINAVSSSPMDAPHSRHGTPASSSSNVHTGNANERPTRRATDGARHDSSSSALPPDTKATAQAAASLMRSIAVPIKDLVDDYDGQASTSTGGRAGSIGGAAGARTRSATPSSLSHSAADGGTQTSTSGFGAAVPRLVPNMPLSISNLAPTSSMDETRDRRSPSLRPPRDFPLASSSTMSSAHDRTFPVQPHDQTSLFHPSHSRSPTLAQRGPSFSEAGAGSRPSTMLIRTRRRSNRQDNRTQPRISRPPMPSALATHPQQAFTTPEMTERDIQSSILASLEVLVAQLREARGQPRDGQS
ncbi:SubName: Full=Uncharacterized protein {ECO:0000313/EMBL:CCA70327.1} [Serendipita indica DSM 11827]|nr:SubName: Full=Uncharacterized protein {ECO:0000313/EMBL:CCA70327.1} [Serendipita indica DSM 11827]